MKYLLDSGGERERSINDWITFTPDGKQLAVLLMGNAVRLIDLGTGEVTRTFEPGWASSACAFSPDGTLAFAPDGATLARGGWGDARLRLWETVTGKEPVVFPS